MQSLKGISHCISMTPRRHCLPLIVRKQSDEKLLQTILLHFVLNLIQVNIWPPTEKNARKRMTWWHRYGRKCIINFALPSNVTAAGMHEFFSGKKDKLENAEKLKWTSAEKLLFFAVYKHDVFPKNTSFFFRKVKLQETRWTGGKGERKTILLVLGI